MLIASAADSLDKNETVPEYFEDAGRVFIIETDDNSLAEEYDGDAGYLARMVAQSDAEAIACGKFRTGSCFESIASVGISRYYAAGLHPLAAVSAVADNALPLMTVFEEGIPE